MGRKKHSKFNKEERDDSKKESRSKEQSSKTENTEDDVSKPSATNDPNWYGREPQLLVDAASIPFSDVFGTAVRLFTKEHVYLAGKGRISVPSSASVGVIPGIAVLETYSSIGDSSDRNSPANVAATALYTHVRYVNSGRKNYDPSDLMMYCLTIAELYAFINWMIRIYNCAFIFSQRNSYVGKRLLEAQHIDPSIVKDLAALRYWINIYIAKIASYAAPSSLYYFAKRAFMYANVYTESASGNIKDQLYMYNPSCFKQYTLDPAGKGMLKNIDVTAARYTNASGYVTYNGLTLLGEDLLSNIFGDEDFGLMSGDILKAFNNDILTVSPIGTEGGLLPVYDPMVLHQMKNSKIACRYHGNSYDIPIDSDNVMHCRAGDIYQDVHGNLVSHHFVSMYTSDVSSGSSVDTVELLLNGVANPIIAIDAPVSDPAVVVEATRNIVVEAAKPVECTGYFNDAGDWQALDSSDLFTVCVDTGDTVVERLRTYTAMDSTDGMYIHTYESGCVHIGTGITQVNKFENIAKDNAMFKYLPIISRVEAAWDPNTTSLAVQSMDVISDLWNYTVQQAPVIRRLHELSMLSLLYVPGVAKQVNYMK